jgi:adenylylsulfate kinase
VSWRIFGSLTTAILVYIFSRKWELAIAVGGLEFLLKIGVFYLHERVWDRVQLGKLQLKPSVIWFTGLSGAGKTTLAKAVMEELRKRPVRVEHLDGDTIRDIFPNTGFSREEREEHIRRVGYLASRLEKNGLFVVASLISPYESSRQFVRSLCTNFVEIHVSTPLSVCEERDPKGLYKRARAGEITSFTGISAPYEIPANAELKIDTAGISIDDAVRQVFAFLDSHAK